MAFCKNCGSSIPDDVPFCSYCGAAQSGGLPPEGGIPPYPPQPVYGPPSIRPEPVPPYTPPVRSEPTPPYTPQPTYSTPYPPQPTYPMTVSNTGTIVWASILIFFGLFFLLHLPFAIVGIVYAAGINDRMPPDAQQKKLKSARTWCAVSTAVLVLTVLLFVLVFGLLLAGEPY